MASKNLMFQIKKGVEQGKNSAHATVENTWIPSSERIQQILQIRALALAQEPLAQEARDEGIQIVEFTLGYERYALESCYITQIAYLENIIPVPCTPAFVRGIVSLRGEILPVIDLKKFFELPEKELSGIHKVVVLRAEKMTFGILADQILGVSRILATDILPSLPTLTGIRKKYLKGVTPERLVVLDAAKLLMDESLIVEEQIAE